MKILRILVLTWLSAILVSGVVVVSPLQTYGLELLIAFGLFVHAVPTAVLLICGIVVHAAAVYYVLLSRPTSGSESMHLV